MANEMVWPKLQTKLHVKYFTKYSKTISLNNKISSHCRFPFWQKSSQGTTIFVLLSPFIDGDLQNIYFWGLFYPHVCDATYPTILSSSCPFCSCQWHGPSAIHRIQLWSVERLDHGRYFMVRMVRGVDRFIPSFCTIANLYLGYEVIGFGCRRSSRGGCTSRI